MVNNLMTRRRALLKEYGGGTPSGDPWEALFTSINNGTYTTDYATGDLIPLDLGTEGQINMQIVAFDADTLADDTGTAPVTLISKELLATDHRMSKPYDSSNPGGTGGVGGFQSKELHTYLNESVSPLIPIYISNHILKVKKSGGGFSVTGTRLTFNSNVNLWVPSMREIFNSEENSGPTYSAFYYSAGSRKKSYVTIPNSAAKWWLRTASSTIGYYLVNSNGNSNAQPAEYLAGIALGFCVG